MSVSKYRYTESCDGQPCPGDCDLCGKEDDVDDLISRHEVDVLVDELARVLSDRRDGLQRGRHYTKILEDILHLPSAQPERKTGRWIEENPQNSPDCRLIKCSECGDTYIVNMSIDYADWIEGRNFCRRCGADLRGGNNGKST